MKQCADDASMTIVHWEESIILDYFETLMATKALRKEDGLRFPNFTRVHSVVS
jgi:hypothetical protein